MTSVKVSVAITYYNQVDNVDRSMLSVLNQNTTFPIEIIVGDDGSNDGTAERLLYWANRYPDVITVLQMKRDSDIIPSGFRASRNRLNLLKHIKGEYFAFLDGDDYYTDNLKLQKQVDILDKAENRDCTVCAHDIMYIYPDGKQCPKYGKTITEGKYNGFDYWSNLYFHTNTELFRKEIINDIDFKYLENNYNDNLITFLSFQRGLIYYYPACMAAYVQTGKGIWTGQDVIVNLIRNMFICDLSSCINPKYIKYTDIRFRRTWIDLFKHRKEINRRNLESFEAEALDKNMKYSKLWINYNQLNGISKSILLFKLFLVEVRYRLYKGLY